LAGFKLIRIVRAEIVTVRGVISVAVYIGPAAAASYHSLFHRVFRAHIKAVDGAVVVAISVGFTTATDAAMSLARVVLAFIIAIRRPVIVCVGLQSTAVTAAWRGFEGIIGAAVKLVGSVVTVFIRHAAAIICRIVLDFSGVTTHPPPSCAATGQTVPMTGQDVIVRALINFSPRTVRAVRAHVHSKTSWELGKTGASRWEGRDWGSKGVVTNRCRRLENSGSHNVAVTRGIDTAIGTGIKSFADPSRGVGSKQIKGAITGVADGGAHSNESTVHGSNGNSQWHNAFIIIQSNGLNVKDTIISDSTGWVTVS
jgi:hypothetical protein